MARRRISMKKIRSLIRLKSAGGMSDRQIARALQIARPLVGKYWQAYLAGGLSLEDVEGMSDSALIAALERGLHGPPSASRQDSRYLRLSERFPHYLAELKRTGMTLQTLWQEYLAVDPDGFRYSQFCYHFHRWRESSQVRMHLEHKAAEKVIVDYAGKKLTLTDEKTGAQRPVEVFVAVLGASELSYVEACESQKVEDWVLSNDRAIRFFGGVPQVLIPVNLRRAVGRSDPFELGICPTYVDFAEH